MEIKDLFLLMWRNIRYIILGLVLGAGIGVLVSKIQVPVYEATAKVYVSRPRQQGNSDILSMSDEQLLAINLQLAKSQHVLDDVSSQLGSKIDADNIEVAEIPNTLMVQIKVQDHDPQRAAQINKLLVQNLIQQNETLISGQYAGFEDALNEQIDTVQKQIDSLQVQVKQINGTEIQDQLVQVNQQIDQLKIEISGLEAEIAGLPYSLTPFPNVPTPSPLERIPLAHKQSQLDQLHSLLSLYQQIQTNLMYIGKPGQGDSNLEDPRLAALQSTLALYQQINLSLINNRQNVRLARAQNNQNVIQISSAIPPKNPVRPVPILYDLLGGLVGLCLAATAIIVIDHMDDSLKTTAEIEKLLGLSVLGSISDIKNKKNGLVTAYDPDSNEAESFRALGANLEITGVGKSIRTLMIVNAEPANDKTTISANLAVIYAQQGKEVILVDGDLKDPYLHRLFNVENQKGFAELLDGRIDIKSVFHNEKDVEGFTLIPSGIVEKDVKGWLDTEKFNHFLSTLPENANLVIVDSPPADAANAQILASKMEAVLLVIVAGHTHINSAQATLGRFKLNGVRVAGAVFICTMQSWKINKLLKAKLSLAFRKNVSLFYSRIFADHS
jgi:capsular exopolysaccharide synthesis family protein